MPDTGAMRVGGTRRARRARTSKLRRGMRWLFPTPVLAVVVLATCFVVPAFLLTRWVDHNPKLSPIDEGAHLDYVIRTSRGEVPLLGDVFTQKGARITACKGIELRGLEVPSCDERRFEPSDFPAGGFQYEAQQPPLYYAVTAAARPVVQWITGEDDYLTSSRYTGFIWWSLGLFVLWIAGRALRITPWAMASVLLFLACAPNVAYYSTIVSNDAPSLLIGAAMLLVIVLALKREPSLRTAIALVALGIVSALIKATDALPALALALFAGWYVWRTEDDRHIAWRRWLMSGGALLVGAGFAVLAWAVVRDSIGLVSFSELPIARDTRLLGGSRIGPFIDDITGFFGLTTDSFASTWFQDSLQTAFSEIFRTLLLVAAFMGVFVKPRRWFHVLGLSTLVTMIVGAVGVALAFWVAFSQNPSTEHRYGLALAPLLAVAVAAMIESTREKWVVALCGGTALAALSVNVAVLS
jgi:hypothetical protein